MPETLPTIIGRYEIRRELGRGTMGVVYEAHDPALGRNIALKTIRLAFATSAEERANFEERFFAEARIAARLSHPGIVVVHDVGRDAETGTLYIALEHLQGRTLAEDTREGIPIEWREALHMTRRIAEALHHAHAQGVIHRDIKPANIMILRSGEPKIMDFGIAKIETSRIKPTTGGQMFGTPLYMAPEQALGRRVDGRADLFSLGAIAYTLLTGRLAFGGTDASLPKIISRIMTEDPPPPTTVVPDLPPDVDYLVARCLAKSPADRYADGKTLADDIEDVLAGRGPRHRGGWHTASHPEGVRASSSQGDETEDVELELVLDEGPSQAPETAPGASVGSATEPFAPRSRAWGATALVAVVAIVAVVAGIETFAAFQRGRRGDKAETRVDGQTRAMPASRAATPAARAPAASVAGSPSARIASPSARIASPSARIASPSGPPAVKGARLAIDFEHPLSSGTLSVSVDETVVLTRKLEAGSSKNLVAFKLRKGTVEQVVDVAPGDHAVKVRVAWEDKEKAESLTATFKAGATRRLEVRLSRLRKNLSLAWK